MSDRLPYEDQLARKFGDLPLPDENRAWADMKRRLDEQDDKPVVPFWWSGCAGWALLGVLVLGLGWWLLKPMEWFGSSKKTTGTTAPSNIPDKGENKISGTVTTFGDSSSHTIEPPGTGTKPDSITTYPANNGTSGISTDGSKTEIKKGAYTNKDRGRSALIQSGVNDSRKTLLPNDKLTATIQQQTPLKAKRKRLSETPTRRDNKTDVTPPESVVVTDVPEPVSAANNTTKPVVKDSDAIKQSTGDSAAKKNAAGNDVFKKTDTTAIVKNEKADNTKSGNKKDSINRKKLVWSAGIGLQQQIPIAGQKWTPYNAQGRKGSIADYIPSVYARITRPGKWFIEGGFRYGAPQQVKEKVYEQQTVSDTGSAPRFYFRNSYTVKKTFYHEAPLVFNYFIRPGWSLGAGIQWNNFYRALAENELLYHDNIRDSNTILSKVIKPVYRDTAGVFKKSFFQGIIETQYQWKRFSFGARYTFGLQPYIQFSLPGTGVSREKIRSLQLFVRFQLWRSPKRK